MWHTASLHGLWTGGISYGHDLPMMRARCILVTVSFFAGVCGADILRVPSDFATIGSAFDAVADSDTVLVSLGEYYEGLTTPDRAFWLIGDVPPDTGNFPRPLIDVTLSPDSVDAPCLTASAGSDITIERFRFRTRVLSDTLPNVSGVFVSAIHIRIVDCLFDSTRMAVQQQSWVAGTIELERCIFRNNPNFGPYVISPYGAVIAQQCRFQGQAAWQLVGEWGTRVIDCNFSDNPNGTFVNTFGNHVEIRSCTFGPGLPLASHAIILDSFGGVFADNLITDLGIGAPAVEVHVDSTEQCQITGNRFVNLRRAQPIAFSTPLRIYGGNAAASIPPFVVAENMFEACSTTSVAKAIYFHGRGDITGNRFSSNLPDEPAAVVADDADSAQLRGNLFDNNGRAVDTWVAWNGSLDARWNWWGDATGAYNPTFNPDGLGDAVGDSVHFIPWLTDSGITSALEPPSSLPMDFEMESYPNPFNPETKLKLMVPTPGLYEIALFDLVGRKVQDVYEGAVVVDREITLTAGDLPSGVYFARASDAATRKPVATAKLILLR